MAWAAALLAKKKAEASLAAASVSAAAQEDSLSYIQRAARKVRRPVRFPPRKRQRASSRLVHASRD
jgi:hypothetical protein